MKLITTLFVSAFFVLPNMAAEQAMCPIMPGVEIDEEEVVAYRGVEIYMCCAACARAWGANPDYFAAAALAHDPDSPLLPQLEGVELPEIELMPQRFCPINRTPAMVCPESPSVEYQGKTIYFFKASSVRRWERDPDGYFEKAREAGLLPQYDE